MAEVAIHRSFYRSGRWSELGKGQRSQLNDIMAAKVRGGDVLPLYSFPA